MLVCNVFIVCSAKAEVTPSETVHLTTMVSPVLAERRTEVTDDVDAVNVTPVPDITVHEYVYDPLPPDAVAVCVEFEIHDVEGAAYPQLCEVGPDIETASAVPRVRIVDCIILIV